MPTEELKRKQRVTDQMLTIYSLLRDRYARKAICLTLGILGSSVVLVACTFLPQAALGMVGISSFSTKVLLGSFSSLVLVFSIAELRVDWKERSRQYGEAADRLAKLKSKYRAALAGHEPPSASVDQELSAEYDTALDGLPRIPDKSFLKLKSYHLRKVRLSQMIDEAVGCPLLVLRFRLFVEGFRRKTDNKTGSSR